jgi:hypothetical protein
MANHQTISHGRRFQDLTGQRFGRLVVQSFIEASKNGSRWLCICDCGNTNNVLASNLKAGHCTSCGCFQREDSAKRIHIALAAKITHGRSKTPEYRIWKGMICRCYNKNRDNYPRYGGRGIMVCEMWRHSFEAFIADVGPRPSPKHTLDRYPDTNGHYEPQNVRWAVLQEQNNNRRNNRIIEYNGERKTIMQWSRTLNTSRRVLSDRLDKLGWSVEQAFTTPVKHYLSPTKHKSE